MEVAGFDPSLSSFGAARASSEGLVSVELRRWQPGKRRGHERLDWFRDQVREFAAGCDLALVEGAAVSRVLGGEAHLNLAGLHWLVREWLHDLGVPYAVVQPSVRAKYITGNGSAGKEDCLLAVDRRFPSVGVKGTDDADAFTLAAMGLDRLGYALAFLPAAQRAVLTAVVAAKKNKPAHPAIEWPDLGKAA